MTYQTNKIIVRSIMCCSIIAFSLFLILGYSMSCAAETHKFQEDKKLKVKISKSGLNRIYNPPYKIIQVTGDDSKFRIKYDDDGTNIYFMPVVKIGESVEISLKNNAGLVQDLELIVSNIKGKSIIIDSKTTQKTKDLQLDNISQMLRAMRDDIEGKFYVQKNKQKLDNIGSLYVSQEKIYKYKNLVGGVFYIKNPTRKNIAFKPEHFSNRFDNVMASYADSYLIKPKAVAKVLIVQMLEDK